MDTTDKRMMEMIAEQEARLASEMNVTDEAIIDAYKSMKEDTFKV